MRSAWLLALILRAVVSDDTDDDDYSTSYTETAMENEARTLNGSGNNEYSPLWGSVGQLQLRSLAQANYTDGASEVPGDGRPTARELLSEVFLSTPTSSCSVSTLYVAWGLLLGFDMVLTKDNSSEPFDVPCNEPEVADVWCPYGSASYDIPFNRSEGGINEDDGARSPINYATAYVDLDWIYGRDEEAAAEVRTGYGGRLNLTSDGIPPLRMNGTVQVVDQRPLRYPATFALEVILMREHNRCCEELAADWGASTDDDIYKVCRQWTIAVFQHVTENDFAIKLLGGAVKTLGAEEYDTDVDDDDYEEGQYDETVDAGVDVFFSTVGLPAFYSALPATVWLLDDDFLPEDEHGVELATVSADVYGLVTRLGGIEPILRGAAYSRSQTADSSFLSEVAASSPLFNLAVETVQRGRDHGVPTYNDAREAYGLDRVSSFSDMTSDETVQGLLSDAYGGDVSQVDAYVGALVEEQTDGANLFVGPLLQAVFLEQLYRSIQGDRHHHSHSTVNEDAALTVISDVIDRNANASSNSTMPSDSFTAPELEVANDTSSDSVTLEDGYILSWELSSTVETGSMSITLSAMSIGTLGMLGLGFGGDTMSNTDDFVICLVTSEDEAVCSDRKGTGSRTVPDLDSPTNYFNVTKVEVDGDWTSVTFTRPYLGDGEDEDYNLFTDVDAEDDTNIIYAWRSGEGLEQHPNAQRGAATVNFATGDSCSVCDDSNDFYALHGALILLVWMVVAPYGIFQARYRKGKNSFMGNLWWEMHEECMVVCAEAVLPLSITAIVTTGGPHTSEHAKWGFYMMAAIGLQLLTGWLRVRGLEAKGSNFSLFHRANKFFHIYAGWFAFVAGIIQCYRGLELVSGSDSLVFSTLDIDFELSNFSVVEDYLFPTWLALVPPFFLYMEFKKQVKRYFTKGAANLCGMVEVVNEDFTEEGERKAVEDRLMPRTEELPIYTSQEFNEKILNGRAWVIVDGAILDVSSFAKRHPGGARIITNAMGTDVTSEILGEDASMGNANMTYSPHQHSKTALEIARTLVVGYMEEDDDMDPDTEGSVDTDGMRRRGSSASLPSESEASSHSRRSLSRRMSGEYREPGTGARIASFSSDDEGNGRRSRLPPGGNSSAGYSSAGNSSGGEKSGVMTPGRGAGGPRPRGRRATLRLMGSSHLMLSTRIGSAETPVSSDKEGGGLAKQDSMVRATAAVGGKQREPSSKLDSVPSGLGMVLPLPGRPKEVNDPVPRSELRAIGSIEASRPTTEQDHFTQGTRQRLGKMLRRLSTLDKLVSGDEAGDPQDEPRLFKDTKRVWQKKNPLLFFHVCPLLHHKRLTSGGERPMYSFIFSCPGKAAALVNAMVGVCHFNMRIARDGSLGVVQRSYNAFPVRAMADDGGDWRIMPATETMEGELCIEMRIRIYPDGAMSKLLMQLIKNADNPAVQLQGPFLQDRLNPPPTYRNVVMIAAGTGVNPMVQLIRDYIFLDAALRNEGASSPHSRLVLLWQNNSEDDLYCTDEITELQAKAGGLLQVAALISGDKTRRNKPGAAFRRAQRKAQEPGQRSSGETKSAEDRDVEEGGGAAVRSSAKPPKSTPGEEVKATLNPPEATSAATAAAPEPKASPVALRASGLPAPPATIREDRDQGQERGHPGFMPAFLPPLLSRPLSCVQEEDESSLRTTESRRTLKDSSDRGARAGEQGEGNESSAKSAARSGGQEEEGKQEDKRPDSDGKGDGRMPRVRNQVRFKAAPESRAGPSSDSECMGITVRFREDPSPTHKRSRTTSISAVTDLMRDQRLLKRALAERIDFTDDDTGRSQKRPSEATASQGTGAGEADAKSEQGGFKSRAGGPDQPASKGRDEEVGQGAPRMFTRTRRKHASKQANSAMDAGNESSTSEDVERRADLRPRVRDRARRSAASSERRRHTGGTSRSKGKGRRARSKPRDVEPADDTPLDNSGTGLRRGAVSKELIKRALGPSLVEAIAATRVSAAGSLNVDMASRITENARRALERLCGTATQGGLLQVIVSGPPGFVFHVENLLTELKVPHDAVILLG